MTGQVMAAGTLDGHRVVVSGAGSGIGQAIALRLVELGATVLGLGRRVDALAATQQAAQGMPGGFVSRSVDVRDGDALVAAIGGFGEDGPITGLVNNAGGQFAAPAARISLGGWRAVVGLNLDAVFAAIQAVHPYMADGGGAVVSISLSGVERGSVGLAHAVAARAGVLGLTRTLALEWAASRIRVNCVGPGTVLTKAFVANTGPELLQGLVDAVPAGRPTAPAEVAELVAFLVSDAGAMITGQLLHVDGGAHLGPGLHMPV
jgi:citronellol/citronellal dehydrogenase